MGGAAFFCSISGARKGARSSHCGHLAGILRASGCPQMPACARSPHSTAFRPPCDAYRRPQQASRGHFVGIRLPTGAQWVPAAFFCQHLGCP